MGYGLAVSFTYSKSQKILRSENGTGKKFFKGSSEIPVLRIFKSDFSLHVMQSLISDHER